MATVSTGSYVTNQADSSGAPRHWSSGLVAVADTLEVDAGDGNFGGFSHPHIFIGIRLYDSNGDQIAAAGAGEFTITAKTWNTGVWESITDGSTIDATAPATSSVQATLEGIRVEPTTAVTGNDVTSYEVRVSGHAS